MNIKNKIILMSSFILVFSLGVFLYVIAKEIQIEGKFLLDGSNLTIAPFNIPRYGTADPTTTVSGDVWYRSNNLYYNDQGTVRAVAHTSSWGLISEAAILAGTETSSRFISAARLKYAFNNVATPTSSSQAAPKSYVDTVVSNASSKWTTSGTNTYLTTTTNNVGIGTTTPGYKLDVSGYINATNFGTYSRALSSSQTVDNTLDDWGSDVFKDTNTNFFGLRVVRTGSFPTISGGTAWSSGLYWHGSDTGGFFEPAYSAIQAQVGGIVHNHVNWSRYVTLRSVTAPTDNQVAVWSSAMETEGTSGLTYDGSKMYINGNVGIGQTSPSYKLDVSGTGRFTGTVSVATPTASNHVTTKSYVDAAVSNASSKWTTSGTKTYLTTTTNNVGIGTTSPSYKLDVSGTVRSSGEIISTSANAFRAISGNYGSIIRNDGSSTYLLLTASADQYGSWNTLRPFVVNNSTGSVNLGNGSLFVNHGGNVGVGNTSPAYKLTVNGTIGTPDMNNPYLVLDSSGSGGNAAEQSAQISLGEAGRGSASLHLAYTGDGYSYIGMGALSGNIPTYYAMKLFYTNNNVYFPGSIGIGQASPGYKLDVSGTGRFTSTVIAATPTASNHLTTKAYVDAKVPVVTLRDVASGTTGNAVCTANSSVCLDVVVAAAPYPSLSYSCLWTNTGDTLKARCFK